MAAVVVIFFFRGVDWSSHYGIFFLAVKKANRGVKYRKRYTINTRLCSKKKKKLRKPNVVNLWNLGYPAYDLYEKRLRFPGCQRAIVRCQEGPPGAATAQPWNAWISVCILKDKWSYLCFSHHWTLAQLHLHFALILKIFDNLMHCMCKSSVYMKQYPNSNLRNHCYDNGIFHNGLYPRYLLD